MHNVKKYFIWNCTVFNIIIKKVKKRQIYRKYYKNYIAFYFCKFDQKHV